ncbi:MAG: DUF1810 domain-containing protein [Betaproteobacteria bacterium]
MSGANPLNKFELAQEQVWDEAMREIRAGRKQTHWMWFVFPQLHGLGSSSKSRHFGIAGLTEALAFAAHPVLGDRLQQSIQAVLDSPTQDMEALFGRTDAMKFLSCLTLFERAPQTAALCTQALRRLYGDARDQRTLELLQAFRFS